MKALTTDPAAVAVRNLVSSKQLSVFFTTLFLSCFFILTTPGVKAYAPPIGIPDPGMWGDVHPIDSPAPAQPGAWPEAEVANYYYIDVSHAQSTDTGNAYGYPNKPRRTIPTTYAAGAYVEVHGGPYATDMTLTLNGTVANPIWFRGSVTAPPTFTGRITITNGAYAIFEYIDFNGGANACININGVSGNHLAIRHSKFRNRGWTGNTAAIGSTPAQNGAIHDIVIYDNLFHDLGDWQTFADDDFHAINPTLWGRTAPTTQYNFWALNNTAYHISGNLVQTNGGEADAGIRPYLHHVYVGKNYAYENRQSGVSTKEATDVIVSQNKIHSNYKNLTGEGTGILYQYAPNNLWIIFNEIYDVDHGIRQSSTSTGNETNKAYIIGNVIHDIHPKPDVAYSITDGYKPGQAISLWGGNQERWIVDNTISDVHGGINIALPYAVTVSGNIIANVVNASDYHIGTLNTRTNVSIDRELFKSNTLGNVMLKWYGFPAYSSVAAFTAATGQCANCWTGDPLFNDPAAGDFSVAANSPAVGRNSQHAVYDIFAARYGISIARDFNNNPRPATGAWTLGAYEYTGVTPPADATAPTVTAFTIPDAADSLTVPITTFTATDNTAVTGYLLTESSLPPVVGNSDWITAAPTTYTFSSVGPKILYAWAKDATGNVSANLNATVTITIAESDTTSPETTIDTHPEAASGTVDASFTFSASEAAIFQCRLDTTAYAICSSPQNYTNLMEGAHAFSVKAIDSAQNEDMTPATYVWTIAIAPPTNNNPPVGNIIPIDDAAPTLSNLAPSGELSSSATSATLSLTTDENATCKYATTANMDYATMPSTFTTTGEKNHARTIEGLRDGTSYAYFMRCQDALGNANAEDRQLTFSIKKKTSSGSSKKKKVAARTISISKKKVSRGQVIMERGNRFSKNSPVALYFSRSNGGYYPPVYIKTTRAGKFALSYIIPANKPTGKYSWYAVDSKTGKRSKTIRFEVR